MKILALYVTLAVLLASPAGAAKDSREKQMLRRVQQQAQQAEQARAQAEQEKASLLAEKETLEKEFKQTQSEVSSAKNQAHKTRSENARLEKELLALRKDLADLNTRLEDTHKQLSDSSQLQKTTSQSLLVAETAKKQTEASLQEKTKTLEICRDHNGRLYATGRDLMVKYQEKSCKDAALQSEPFTGLKKVEMENLFETWRDKLDKVKLP